jgi:hypothetical protein
MKAHARIELCVLKSYFSLSFRTVLASGSVCTFPSTSTGQDIADPLNILIRHAGLRGSTSPWGQTRMETSVRNTMSLISVPFGVFFVLKDSFPDSCSLVAWSGRSTSNQSQENVRTSSRLPVNPTRFIRFLDHPVLWCGLGLTNTPPRRFPDHPAT